MKAKEERELFIWFVGLEEWAQMRFVEALINACDPEVLERIRRSITLDRG